jgi:Copper binding proteins, plastocyanin/azurin family
MIRAIIPLLAAGATALLLSSVGSARPAVTPTLKGTVGPGFTISLKRNGVRVKSLKAGRYKFVIADKASIHNFTLEQQSGGKFERDLTTVSFVGAKTVTVTLKKGKWKYYCTPHESIMFGFFTVK